MAAKLMAVSDIHVGHNGNKPMTEELFPDSPDDWLILAGDVSEKTDDIRWALKLLRSDSQRSSGFRATTNCGRPPRIRFRFTERRGTSTWSTCAANSTSSRPRTRSRCGRESRARSRSSRCSFSTTTPSCRKRARQGTRLEIARDKNVVATDEFLLSPQPYATRDAWCRARIEYTQARLDALPEGTKTVLVNHFPMVRQPTDVLMYPEFALWCGTTATADWHVKYNAVCSVYGHLHIPRTTYYDGVRFEEVSLGYPREWRRRGLPEKLLRQILPVPEYPPGTLNKWGGHFKVTPEQEAEVERMRAGR